MLTRAQLAALSDTLLLTLYEAYSEDEWCCGHVHPSPGVIERAANWIERRSEELDAAIEPYQRETLALLRAALAREREA